MKRSRYSGATWFLSGNRDRASSRLQGYLIHEYLEQYDFRSKLFLAPPVYLKDLPWTFERIRTIADLVETPVAVFQKLYGDRTNYLISLLKQRGIQTVFVECDLQSDNTTPLLCDHVVVPSEFLYQRFIELGAQCTVIPDPVEWIVSEEALHRYHQGRRQASSLRLIWVGHRAKWSNLETLRKLIKQPNFRNFRLVTISSHPRSDIRWELDTVQDHIRSGDIGVVPTGTGPAYQTKSANRITLFMALGLPVVAGRIPAYENLIRPGENGFLCETEHEWSEALQSLTDPTTRLKIAQCAYQEIVTDFRLEAIGEKWIRLLRSLAANRQYRPSVPEMSRNSHDMALVSVDTNLTFSYETARRARWREAWYYAREATKHVSFTWSIVRLYIAFWLANSRHIPLIGKLLLKNSIRQR